MIQNDWIVNIKVYQEEVRMMKKKTDDLVNEIVGSSDLSQYMDMNAEEFIDMPLDVYLRQLLEERDMKVSQVADASYRGDYIYKVFQGKRVNPGRDVILCIALAMQLNLEETKQLLRIARVQLLDARNRRDSIVIFALKKKLSVPEANEILYEFGQPCLYSD